MEIQRKDIQEIVTGYKPAVKRIVGSLRQAELMRKALETAGYTEIIVTPLEAGAMMVEAGEVKAPEDVLE